MRKHLCLLFITLLAAVQIAGADGGLPTLVVAPMKGEPSQIPNWQPAMGEGLAEMLTTEISKANKFEVLESTHMDDLIKEINLGEQGFVDKDEKVNKGGFSGADYMFIGKVTQFGSKKQEVGGSGFSIGSFGAAGVGLSIASVRLDWRLTDIATRKIIKTGSANAEQTGVDFNIATGIEGKGGGISFQNSEFIASALGKATVKAIKTIMADMSALNLPASSGRNKQHAETARAVTAANQATAQLQKQERQKITAQVLAVVGRNTVIVSLGGNQGVKIGESLKLFQPVELKDEKGEIVFSEDKEAGEIEVEAVQDERCKAIYRGTAEVKKGWIVRPQ